MARPMGFFTDTTVCIAASVEAKTFGVKTGTKVADARRMRSYEPFATRFGRSDTHSGRSPKTIPDGSRPGQGHAELALRLLPSSARA